MTSSPMWRQNGPGITTGPAVVNRRLVDPGELIAVSDVQDMTGWSTRKHVLDRLARDPTFPRPVYDRKGTRLWVRSDVTAWCRHNGL